MASFSDLLTDLLRVWVSHRFVVVCRFRAKKERQKKEQDFYLKAKARIVP